MMGDESVIEKVIKMGLRVLNWVIFLREKINLVFELI